MSVDERLRRGLEANASALVPKVETSLLDVRRRGRRADRARMARAGVLIVAAAACVTFVVRSAAPDDRPTAPSASAPTSTADLFGRYEADIARPPRLAGHWAVELRASGSAVVTAPDGYAGVVSGTIFTADRVRLRINLFAQDVCANLGDGEYVWARAGDRLVLAVSNDLCQARIQFFSQNKWVEVARR
jgi:hypothetical protein